MQLENPFQTILDKLYQIENTLIEIKLNQGTVPDTPESDLLNIDQAAALMKMSKKTIYYLSCKAKIPLRKKGRRLYFSKKELLEWVESGRRATIDEISGIANSYVEKRKAFRM